MSVNAPKAGRLEAAARWNVACNLRTAGLFIVAVLAIIGLYFVGVSLLQVISHPH